MLAGWSLTAPLYGGCDLGDLYMQGVEAVHGEVCARGGCLGCVWQRPWYNTVRRWLQEAQGLRARGPMPRIG